MSAAFVHGGLNDDEEQARLMQEEINRVEAAQYDPSLALGAGVEGGRPGPYQHHYAAAAAAAAPVQRDVVPRANEFGYFEPSPAQLAAAPHAPNAGGVGAAHGRRATRQATITVFYARLKLVALVVATILAIPQLVAIIAIVPFNFHPGACDHPIWLWLIFLGVQLISHLTLVYVVYFKPQCTRSCQGFDQALNISRFLLLILGMVWVVQSRTCQANDPKVYQLAWYLFISLVAILCIPMMILLLAIPVACCCTTCVHSMLQYWLGDHRGANDSVLAELTSEIYREGRFADKSDATCAICSSDYVIGDSLRVLPCPSHLHHFHQNCIDKWLKINSSCPICRHPIGPRREEDIPDDGV